MLKIGLTGGIGSGKSTVADYFAKLHVPIIDSDVITRELTIPATPAYFAIVHKFGPEIVINDALNRRKLREIVFADPEARQWLEALLHPLVRDSIRDQATKLSSPYAIIIIPLLIESGTYDLVDRILVVDSPVELQIERVMKRDSITRDAVMSIINTQASKEGRLNEADDVIYNDGNIIELFEQVKILHHKYLQLARGDSP